MKRLLTVIVLAGAVLALSGCKRSLFGGHGCGAGENDPMAARQASEQTPPLNITGTTCQDGRVIVPMPFMDWLGR